MQQCMKMQNSNTQLDINQLQYALHRTLYQTVRNCTRSRVHLWRIPGKLPRQMEEAMVVNKSEVNRSLRGPDWIWSTLENHHHSLSLYHEQIIPVKNSKHKWQMNPPKTSLWILQSGGRASHGFNSGFCQIPQSPSVNINQTRFCPKPTPCTKATNTQTPMSYIYLGGNMLIQTARKEHAFLVRMQSNKAGCNVFWLNFLESLAAQWGKLSVGNIRSE